MVGVLGEFPLPVEIIPMARSYVGREIVKLGGDPVYREGCVTDNGNHILDVYNLDILDPSSWRDLNQITGVVTNGLFAQRGADILLSARQTAWKPDGQNHFPEGERSVARHGMRARKENFSKRPRRVTADQAARFTKESEQAVNACCIDVA